jgi:hypothetical protein
MWRFRYATSLAFSLWMALLLPLMRPAQKLKNIINSKASNWGLPPAQRLALQPPPSTGLLYEAALSSFSANICLAHLFWRHSTGTGSSSVLHGWSSSQSRRRTKCCAHPSTSSLCLL